MWMRVIVGVLLCAAGAVWFAQGIGTLHGSFMTGERFWAVIGAPLFVAGLFLIVTAFRRGSRATQNEPDV